MRFFFSFRFTFLKNSPNLANFWANIRSFYGLRIANMFNAVCVAGFSFYPLYSKQYLFLEKRKSKNPKINLGRCKTVDS